LALANLISTNIVAVNNQSTAGIDIVGITVPASKVTSAGYFMIGNYPPWYDRKTNATFIGTVNPTGGLTQPALKPMDAFNIDKKIDDGNDTDFVGAITGKFRTTGTGNCSTWQTGAYHTLVTTIECISGLALN
jgi:hypothetical protein